jgi:hypothetical protein
MMYGLAMPVAAVQQEVAAATWVEGETTTCSLCRAWQCQWLQYSRKWQQQQQHGLKAKRLLDHDVGLGNASGCSTAGDGSSSSSRDSRQSNDLAQLAAQYVRLGDASGCSTAGSDSSSNIVCTGEQLRSSLLIM